jgi:hypothetical protein
MGCCRQVTNGFGTLRLREARCTTRWVSGGRRTGPESVIPSPLPGGGSSGDRVLATLVPAYGRCCDLIE